MADDPLLTVAQLAALEGVPQWEVRRWLRAGLPCYRAAGIRVRLSEFRAWLALHRTPESGPVSDR